MNVKKLLTVYILLFLFLSSLSCNENSENKYIKKILKEYTLCECLTIGNYVEGNKNIDASSSRLFHLLPIDAQLFRKIDSVLNNIYSNSTLRDTIEGVELNYYFHRCLKFYEGAFLDSLVNSFDDLIKLDEYELNNLKSQYQYDSLYIEELIIESQQKTENE